MSGLPPWFAGLSYAGLFGVIFATGAGLPLPEDVALLGAGWLVFTGAIQLHATIAVALAAVLAGDVFLYVLGHRVGRRLVTHPRLERRFPPERLARAERFFQRWGLLAIVLARLIAGLRAAVYLTAGVLRVPFARFLFVDALAAAVHVPLLVLAGRLAAQLTR
jgi:membrane-associated protein